MASLVGLTVMAEMALSPAAESLAPALLCDLALIAAFVAASERRHTAMLAATGLACGLATYGAMLLPLAIGLTISRKVAIHSLLLIPLIACFAIVVLGEPPLAPGSIGLWSITPLSAVTGLLVARAVGSLAWLTAMLSARPLMPDMLPIAALACALCCALVMPGASMAVPLALALVYRDRRFTLLVALATLLAALGTVMPATLTLGVALILAAKPLLVSAANDNPVFAHP